MTYMIDVWQVDGVVPIVYLVGGGILLMCGGSSYEQEGTEGWAQTVVSHTSKVFVETVAGCASPCAFCCHAASQPIVINRTAITGMQRYFDLAGSLASPAVVLHGAGDPSKYPWAEENPSLRRRLWSASTEVEKDVMAQCVVSLGPVPTALDWLTEHVRVRVKVETVEEMEQVKIYQRAKLSDGWSGTVVVRPGIERIIIPGRADVPVVDILRAAKGYYCVVQSNGTRAELLKSELRAAVTASGRRGTLHSAKCDSDACLVVDHVLGGRLCLDPKSPCWEANGIIELARACIASTAHANRCNGSIDWFEARVAGRSCYSWRY